MPCPCCVMAMSHEEEEEKKKEEEDIISGDDSPLIFISRLTNSASFQHPSHSFTHPLLYQPRHIQQLHEALSTFLKTLSIPYSPSAFKRCLSYYSFSCNTSHSSQWLCHINKPGSSGAPSPPSPTTESASPPSSTATCSVITLSSTTTSTP